MLKEQNHLTVLLGAVSISILDFMTLDESKIRTKPIKVLLRVVLAPNLDFYFSYGGTP